jgi:hypothetical protein
VLKLFDGFVEALADKVWDEEPVPLKEWVESDKYMDLPSLSYLQQEVLEAMTNILKVETIEELWGSTNTLYADYLKTLRVREVVAMVGKGGGKNHITTLAVARVAYLLLCMNDPATYYGLSPGSEIATLNIAVNSEQAKNGFFRPLTQMIRRSPWFRGKYDDSKQGVLRFAPNDYTKNITAYSGHSQREAWEGFNFIFIVLDEIAAFKTDAESTKASHRADTAPALYSAYRAAVTSRFGLLGKLCLLSFPRFRGDYITERYNEVAIEVERIEYSEDFAINPDKPMEGANKLTLTWFEEKVIGYNAEDPFVYALRTPSWKFNPTKSLQEYIVDFSRDMKDSLSRYACNPPDAVDAFFTDKERVEEAFREVRSPFTDRWEFLPDFSGIADVRYYMHVDLAQKSDRAAIAVAHIDGWMEIGSGPYKTVEPIIKIDAVRYWTPTPGKNIDFTQVKGFIDAVKRKGFRLTRVTFDRWAGSVDMQNNLVRDGVEVETLSVGREQYNAFQTAIYDGRLNGYHLPLLVDELMGLQLNDKGKVDHTASGSNDLADAVAGAAALCMKYEERPLDEEVNVYYLDEIDSDEGLSSIFSKTETPKRPELESPSYNMPDEIEIYLEGYHVI